MPALDDDNGAIDELIDRTVRELTTGEPSPHLARRVRARVDSGRRAPRVPRWQLAGAMAVMILAVVLWRVWPTQRVVAPAAGPSPRVVQQAPDDGQRLPVGIGREIESGPRAGLSTLGGRGAPSPDTDSYAVAGASRPIPPIAPLDVAPIGDERFALDSSALTMPIEIAPLQIAPLELQ